MAATNYGQRSPHCQPGPISEETQEKAERKEEKPRIVFSVFFSFLSTFPESAVICALQRTRLPSRIAAKIGSCWRKGTKRGEQNEWCRVGPKATRHPSPLNNTGKNSGLPQLYASRAKIDLLERSHCLFDDDRGLEVLLESAGILECAGSFEDGVQLLTGKDVAGIPVPTD